jgi:hypothetical protein
MLHPLSNSYIPLCLHTLLLSGLKHAAQVVLQACVLACRTNVRVFIMQLLTRPETN